MYTWLMLMCIFSYEICTLCCPVIDTFSRRQRTIDFARSLSFVAYTSGINHEHDKYEYMPRANRMPIKSVSVGFAYLQAVFRHFFRNVNNSLLHKKNSNSPDQLCNNSHDKR
uniref:Secreted protein n=1 Tax=Glypta fumiferanae TaxID=389681 RepID=A0A0F6Q789_9HYME|nr:hypothetical protein [Glypta fumiferanae]